MKQRFKGWHVVSDKLRDRADSAPLERLNEGQRRALKATAGRIQHNGVLIADEVGMGKTRIAVEIARCVVEAGGRVAILVPPGLGFQWKSELREGGIPVARPLLRSLKGFRDGWDEHREATNWFEEPVVVISHSFSNWRMRENPATWRWALLPEVYAHGRKSIMGRWPRGYESTDSLMRDAAERICAAIVVGKMQPALGLLKRIIEETPWPGALDSEEYGRDEALRPWLERAVGLGLGHFDLTVIDEAHKSRGQESGLSRLLERVLVEARGARRIAMTATPVELDEAQWLDPLGRIGLHAAELEAIEKIVKAYGRAVRRVRECWRTSPEVRREYVEAAQAFQCALSQFVLRRDKREDPAIQDFERRSGLSIHRYRSESEVLVDTERLPGHWQQAVCAAEALSAAARVDEDSSAKRLRLTMGSGHGISSFVIGEVGPADKASETENGRGEAPCAEAVQRPAEPSRRQQRATWWRGVVQRALIEGGCVNGDLYFHPAIRAAVAKIEEVTGTEEKVLVFGRFTKPMQDLVELLNAREMLQRLSSGDSWPRSKVHGARRGGSGSSEWPAVLAAHQQLGSTIDLSSLDAQLGKQYERARRTREKFRDQVLALLETGLNRIATDRRHRALFEAMKLAIRRKRVSESDDRHLLSLVARTLAEHIGSAREDVPDSEWAQAFCSVMDAALDHDEDESGDGGELDASEAAELWSQVEGQLVAEYNRPQGGFARFMFGATTLESRRMIQLAFNRPHSFPRVLVAQSLVGREGLNLHQACRVVVLLHPEWNPGVVEQQIGRVDRVGSRWAMQMEHWTGGGSPPRIEIHPIMFRGTYDEHNWKVLRKRWDDYRAQLHGIVVPDRLAGTDAQDRAALNELAEHAPKFSPREE